MGTMILHVLGRWLHRRIPHSLALGGLYGIKHSLYIYSSLFTKGFWSAGVPENPTCVAHIAKRYKFSVLCCYLFTLTTVIFWTHLQWNPVYVWILQMLKWDLFLFNCTSDTRHSILMDRTFELLISKMLGWVVQLHPEYPSHWVFLRHSPTG